MGRLKGSVEELWRESNRILHGGKLKVKSKDRDLALEDALLHFTVPELVLAMEFRQKQIDIPRATVDSFFGDPWQGYKRESIDKWHAKALEEKEKDERKQARVAANRRAIESTDWEKN